MATASKVSIYRYDDSGHEVWVGEGRWDEQRGITDCAASLGEEVYEGIEDAIADGGLTGEVRGYHWSVLER